MIEKEKESTRWESLHLLFSSLSLQILIIGHQHREDPWQSPECQFCRTPKVGLYGSRSVEWLILYPFVSERNLPMGRDILSKEL